MALDQTSPNALLPRPDQLLTPGAGVALAQRGEVLGDGLGGRRSVRQLPG